MTKINKQGGLKKHCGLSGPLSVKKGEILLRKRVHIAHSLHVNMAYKPLTVEVTARQISGSDTHARDEGQQQT